MPELLLELFSEEIPARMQAQAGRDLARMATERLAAAGLGFDKLETFAGPRRLTLAVEGLPAAQEDRIEERKGPRANAPEQALAGFLRSTGLTRDQLTERDGVLYATLARPGRPTPEIAAEMVEAIVRGFPWPKSMRWGSGTFRWVRPLQRILCLFDGAVVPFGIDGVASGDLTEGHRFMGCSHRPIKISHYDQYRAALFDHFVILDQADRKRIILDGVRAVCAATGLELIEDEGLLEEVSGLAEWPVPVLGEMDSAFLDLPPEVIRTSMRTHQKYFAVRRPGQEGLAPHFVVVANIEAEDGGAALAAGNAKVLAARLADARFFWDEDRKVPLEDRLEKLKGVVFHAKLGTMYERVERIEALAREIAPLVGCTPEQIEWAATAARLCKADLATGMVGEFPELQGVMGGYYARAAGLEPEVCDAIRDHYKPVGPSDSVPTAPVTVAVALADKLDTLVGFFAIDEKPTGSRDPYALRRAALGIVRILMANDLRIDLRRLLPQIQLSVSSVAMRYGAEVIWAEDKTAKDGIPRSPGEGRAGFYKNLYQTKPEWFSGRWAEYTGGLPNLGIREFFADRLKVLLREEGKRHDLVDAVFALGDDDLVRIVARVEALSGFLATEDGASLLAGYRRAANILKAEEKKGALPTEGEGSANPRLSDHALPEEAALAAALRVVEGEVDEALAAEDFTGAMRRLAHLRAPVDAFFDKVLVNDPDPEVRLRRLRLLAQVRDTANRVADFSLISG